MEVQRCSQPALHMPDPLSNTTAAISSMVDVDMRKGRDSRDSKGLRAIKRLGVCLTIWSRLSIPEFQVAFIHLSSRRLAKSEVGVSMVRFQVCQDEQRANDAGAAKYGQQSGHVVSLTIVVYSRMVFRSSDGES